MTNKTSQLLVAAAAITLTACNALAVTAGVTNTPAKPAPTPDSLFGDPVIAKGKGVEIKRSALDSATMNIKASAAARGQSIPPDQLNMIEQQILSRLIQVDLLNSMATAADKAEGKDRAEKNIEKLLKRTGSETMFNAQLKAMGLTREELESRLAEEATAEVVAERELKVLITDDEAKKYYDEHPVQFEQPERVRAAHILLMTIDPATRQPLTSEQMAAKKKELQDILKRARAGEDFGKLAEEYSEDPGSKSNGGEYTFPRGQMVPEFEAAAFTLGTNQISDIVTTAYGYHVIKVLEKLPANTLTYDKVSDDLKTMLKQQAMIKKLPTYTTQLQKDAKVEILDESLKPKVDPFAALNEEMNTSTKTNGTSTK
jgi:peptidyl-prolyl cis-trans isomerase C